MATARLRGFRLAARLTSPPLAVADGPSAIVDHSDGSRERVSAVHVTSEGAIRLAKLLEKQLADAKAEHKEERAMMNRLHHDDRLIEDDSSYQENLD